MPGAPSRRLLLSVALGTVVWAAPSAGAGQGVGEDAREAAAQDSATLLRSLQGAVDGYERSRRRLAPAEWFPRTGGECDQYVGRMCITLGENSDWWFPEEIPERMEAARAALISELMDGVAALPGDAWILAQLVRYLGEGSEWDHAGRYLDPCPPIERSWCLALRGTALHGAGHYAAAEMAFAGALQAMSSEERLTWIHPGDVVRGEVEDRFEELREADTLSDLEAEIARFWRLSDPFVLAEGNDRWTEHLARRTLVEAQYGRDSAYRVRFRDDLAEVTLRYGWEIGWERRPASVAMLGSESSVVGHQHPYSLPWVVPESAFFDPGGSTARDWTPQSEAIPRSGYAPLYAPNVLPDGEVLVFPRGREAIVAAAIRMPPDTSRHADRDDPPLPLLPEFAGRPATSGLFGLDPDGRLVAEDRRTFPVILGAERDGILGLLPPARWHEIILPVGEWIVSVEHLVPGVARGARLRRGLHIEERLLDQPTLSDLLLLTATEEEPATLEAALEGVAVQSVRAGERVRVGWETWGLGDRRETLGYTLVLEETGGGVVRRVAGWLGLGGDDVVADVTWAEAAPDMLGAHFRSIELETPEGVGEGEYLLRLELRSDGRVPLVSERSIRIVR